MGHRENEKLAELSAAIDALNRGVKPDSGEQEIKELAGVALLLKRTGPPPDAVARLADKLGAELAAKKKRRRLWLTSGVAGTAAAALLVFALNGGPAVTPPPPTLPPGGSVVIESIPARQQAPAGQQTAAKAADNAPADERSTEPAGKEPAAAREEAAPVRERPAVAAADEARTGQRTMLAKAPEKAAAKRAAAYLVWPGHQPDEVTVDKETAAVRQVYGRGGDEIVILQRAAQAPEADSPAAFAAFKGKTNRVTMTVKGTVVTVEGSLPEAELEKIARSLE
jgi:hypothetical protein